MRKGLPGRSGSFTRKRREGHCCAFAWSRIFTWTGLFRMACDPYVYMIWFTKGSGRKGTRISIVQEDAPRKQGVFLYVAVRTPLLFIAVICQGVPPIMEFLRYFSTKKVAKHSVHAPYSANKPLYPCRGALPIQISSPLPIRSRRRSRSSVLRDIPVIAATWL